MARKPSEPILVALGSNIEPHRNLPKAVELLEKECRVEAVSPVYASEPIGGAEATAFLNAAVKLRTEHDPKDLKFKVLRPLEARLGRVRSGDKNAPRTIDLDLAIYGQLVLNDPETGVVVPDPEILKRAHLALPLADLEPGFRHPVSGQTLSQIAGRFADDPDIRIYKKLLLELNLALYFG